MSILGVDARKKIAELIKQIQEQSGGFGPPSAGYGDGKLYDGPEPVVGNAIKKVATFKPEIPFGTDIARKVVEGTENLGNQLVPPLELGPVKLTGSEQLDILLSGLLQKQKGEVEVPAAKKVKTKTKVREPELSPVPTTVPDAVRRRLEAQGKIKPQPTVAPELTKSHIRDPFDDFLENYSTEPLINRAPEEAAKTAAQRERNASKMPQVYELEREFATHPDPEVRSDFAHVREYWLGTDDYLAQLKILQAQATPAHRAFVDRMKQEHWSNFNAPGPLAATNALEEARFKYARGEIDLRTYEDMVDEARKLFDK